MEALEEFSVISMKETISVSDSKTVKRSKFLYAGIKPKQGFEGSILNIALEMAKSDFLELIDGQLLSDVFKDKGSRTELVNQRTFIFGEKKDFNDFFTLDALTIEYLFENSYRIQEHFSKFLSPDLTNREYNALPEAFKLEILTSLYQNNHKKIFESFILFLMDRDPGFVVDFLTDSKEFLKVRNTIKTRELASLRLFISMIPAVKREKIIQEFIDRVDAFEEYLFFNNEEDMDVSGIRSVLEKFYS